MAEHGSGIYRCSILLIVGLIHSESVKINANPQFAIIYVIMAAFFLIVYFISKNNKELQPTEEHIGRSDE